MLQVANMLEIGLFLIFDKLHIAEYKPIVGRGVINANLVGLYLLNCL